MAMLLRQAALFSAGLALPEAGVESLRERYRAYLSPAPVTSSISQPVSSVPLLPETSSAAEPDKETLLPMAEEPEEPVVITREIATENRGTILAQTFTAIDSPIYIQYGEGKIKNSTNLTNAQAQEILNTPCTIPVENTSEPLVLIYHTHATEAYEPLDAEVYDKTYSWRSLDNTVNMVAVGEVLARKLEEAGIGVVHLTQQHDYPSYNGAYDKSAASVRAALEQYPSIKVILDVHRDAIQRDADTIVKAVAQIDGRKAAQLMLVAGCDDDGTLGMPRWESNFRFSAALQDVLETLYPGLCRPVFFCYRKYNMDLCPNGALIEVGSHGNTLEEAKYAAELLANGLALLLKGQ
jgi:stage II sporulation protein P